MPHERRRRSQQLAHDEGRVVGVLSRIDVCVGQLRGKRVLIDDAAFEFMVFML